MCHPRLDTYRRCESGFPACGTSISTSLRGLTEHPAPSCRSAQHRLRAPGCTQALTVKGELTLLQLTGLTVVGGGHREGVTAS